MPDVAKLFWSEGEQAVCLPDNYRFATAEVSIRREGRTLILEPIGDEQAWPDEPKGSVDADFAASDQEPEQNPE